MSMIRWIRFLIANAIVLFSISFIFHIGIASANDVGAVNIDHSAVKSYQMGTPGHAGSIDFTKLIFANSSYQKINEYYITNIGNVSFAYNSNSTYFTCVSGCTGAGFVSYSKTYNQSNGTIIDWLFNPTNTFTARNITLSYEVNIFDANNIPTPANFGVGDVGFTLNGNTPIYLTDATFTYPLRGTTDSFGGFVWHNADVSVITSVNYSVSYPFSLWNAQITKDHIINTKVAFENSTAQQFIESSFNSNNFNASATFTTGLYINVSLSDGYHTTQLINATNANIPTPANVPANNTLNGVGLVWAYNTYTINTMGNLSWSKTTPSLACDNIKIYNPSGSLISTITNPSDAGFYKIMLDKAGTWKAEYIRQTICILSNEEVLNTAYTSVPAPEATYLVINATTIAGKFENVTYRSGTRNPILAPQLKVLDAFGNLEGSFDISGFQINVEGISPVVIITSGQHTIRICDAWGCDDAVAVTNTVFNQSIPTTDITTSNITMDSSVYSFEDHAIVKYAVDNTNFSNKAIYTTSFNWNYGIETTRYVGFVNQTGTLDEHLSLFRGRYTYPGNYSYRLMGRNDTGAYILAFWNFSISSIDNEGYGLSLSKETLCLGESLTLIVNSPGISYMNISHNTNGNIFNSYSINMNKTISYKPSASGTYSVMLYSPEGYTKRAFTFDVSACVTPTPTPGATQGATQAKAMANMLMSNVFWSFIITAGLMIAIAWRTKHGMATVGIGALSMTVFASIGWFPLWAFFSIVIIAALLLSAKWASQFFDIGTSD